MCFISIVKNDFQHFFFHPFLFIASLFGGEMAFLHFLNTSKEEIKSAVPQILKLSG